MTLIGHDPTLSLAPSLPPPSRSLPLQAELFPIERVLSNTDEFTAEACVKRTLAAYEVAKESRHTKSLFMSYVKAVLLVSEG